jgi:hypothetical protein
MDGKTSELVEIEIVRLAKTGMLIGTCVALRALVVHGRTVAEMETRIASEIERLFEGEGASEIIVTKLEHAGTDEVPGAFPVLTYEVTYRARSALH